MNNKRKNDQVLDGTDCVMLSGETANCDFASECVTIMRRICEEAENVIDYGALYLNQRLETLHRSSKHTMDTVEAVPLYGLLLIARKLIFGN